MRLLLLAPPGAGKGTQAVRLARHFGIGLIATGEMLRQAVGAGTPLGQKAGYFVERGDLVPDDLIIELVLDRLKAAQAGGGFVLDGFPRNLAQAVEAEQAGIVIDAAIYLEIGTAEAIRRVLGRSAQQQRADDVESTVRHRIEVFERQTYPLCRYYTERGVLIRVDAEQTPDQVTAFILERLAELPL